MVRTQHVARGRERVLALRVRAQELDALARPHHPAEKVRDELELRSHVLAGDAALRTDRVDGTLLVSEYEISDCQYAVARVFRWTGGGRVVTAAASKNSFSVMATLNMGHGGSIAVGTARGRCGRCDTSGRGAYEVADEDGDECDDNGEAPHVRSCSNALVAVMDYWRVQTLCAWVLKFAEEPL